MNEKMTISMARNIFFGGSLFFVLVFLGLTLGTMRSLPERDHRENITPQVALGKKVWEDNNCVGCHTLLGEGAYFAPELGNVYLRRGGKDGGIDFIKDWIRAQPSGVEGRRQMPQFNLTEEELDAVATFLKWTSEINTAGWPPNIEG
ncbi:nitric oxide reductase, NorC subunit apoprotein [Magnetococcus marinus MC-1]|uniref:Nitric oxide reductase, NorC subunit apoprotein n=1 Tax=Magnetococcus marinus (strain ATCC BAA-1437 / JCM 17883 / MC-1) TaxID=156889 RepID=A0L3V5_MAGMM|nr:cytochrome c [Magnetococcus marinus]ABK42648.1 nitric oxide reductase, NorC subunit apoprotein [Magnetococcus marinus MC-1]